MFINFTCLLAGDFLSFRNFFFRTAGLLSHYHELIYTWDFVRSNSIQFLSHSKLHFENCLCKQGAI